MQPLARLYSFLIPGALSLQLLLPSSAAADTEAVLYYVNDNDSSGSCGGSDFTWGDDTVNYLRDKANAWGFDRVNRYRNSATDFRDFADINEHSDGRDHSSPRGIDSGDVGMIYSHGGRSGCGGAETSVPQALLAIGCLDSLGARR